ncbi:hypothetical protein RvY_04341 [Ramazzottius varieornatus]|uniref:Regulator of telomere elongation helicase 1 homolog n=1 Tax=Ramazzottius varieornatus TaxID=947166 RepID=A0A1D1V0K5_RAMVA|nr:hypothetical protein RvY_04341 [Ramazzottius varieornatus]
MTRTVIRGIEVNFPFEPYEIQINYMEKVIEALQTKSNALLESPTGTGKTLCLLCASLAWLQAHMKSNPPTLMTNASTQAGPEARRRQQRIEDVRSSEHPRIIYASRTHSQLVQVMQELKRTGYNKSKVSVLGSREQMCIHEDVQRLPNNPAKNRACRDKVKARRCKYYMNLEEKMDSLALNPVSDIEELISYGKRHTVCPYFLSKSTEKTADIVFMPYNYIFDPSIRRTMKLELQNAVVILDEGHNVGKVCEESYSYEISSIDLAVAIKEINRILVHLVRSGDKTSQAEAQEQTQTINGQGNQLSITLHEIAELKRALLDFEKSFEAVSLSADSNSGIVKPLPYLTELFQKANVGEKEGQNQWGMLWATLENLTRESEKDESAALQPHSALAVQKFFDLLGVAFQDAKKDSHTFFRVYMRVEDVRKKIRGEGWNAETSLTTKQSRVLSVWCLSPGFTMKTVVASGVHSLLITSGTLSPVEPLLKELMVPFNVQLFNPHIIKSSQVWVGVVGKGPDNVEWTSSFKNRESVAYRRSLGRGIVNFLDVIPDGVLIFFSSYRAMTDCVDTWKAQEVWDDMEKRKECFVESTDRTEFTGQLKQYFELNKAGGKGAAFFGVCRGKISEGVDFPDVCARGVIITGLPYPNKFEPRIRVKMEYLDQSFRNPATKTLSSNEWYNREAWSAVNQSLGRAIRHADDFGACILSDCRFEQDSSKKQLSGWLRNAVRNYSFPVSKRALSAFFLDRSDRQPMVTVFRDTAQNEPNTQSKKRQCSPDNNFCSSAVGCFSEASSAQLTGDDDVLDMYSSQKPERLARTLGPGSVFDAMGKTQPAQKEVAFGGKATATTITASQLSSIPKAWSFSPTSTSTPIAPRAQRKLTVKPILFALDTSEITDKPSQVPGVPTGFVNVVSAPRVTDRTPKDEEISDIVTSMKSVLDQQEFKRLIGVLRPLKSGTSTSLKDTIKVIKSFSTSMKINKVSVMLSSFVPERFRNEYDEFLTDTGILITFE